MSQSPEDTPYSTLEVSPRDPETFQKEVIQYPDHSYPQAVPVEHAAIGGTQSYYGPESAKEVVNPSHIYPGVVPGPYKDPNYAAGSVYHQNAAAYPNGAGYPASTIYSDGSAYPNSAYPSTYGPGPIGAAGFDGEHPPTEKATPTKTICGLTRKTFFIILGVVIVLVIALAAGIPAGLASRTHGSGSTDSAESSESNNGSPTGSPTDLPSNSTDEKLILDNSKITASNWTDPNGIIHRTIFFQDAYNSLIARRWDSKNKSWKTNNLTELMAATTKPLNPQPGTPLASASMDYKQTFETHVWFTDPGNVIRSMASFDALNRPDSWDNDTLDNARLETWPGGQLAAMWQRCWGADCEGTWVVAYQRPEGAIKTANSSTWASATVAVESKDVAANSSLAILPKLRGSWLDRLELVSEQVTSGKTGSMRMTPYDDTWNGADQKVTELQDGIPLPAPSQQFAATRWDNWNQALYLGLLQGGKTEGSHWDGKQMNPISSFQFKSGPETNFTAVAMSPDAMFYGISNNEILEYSLDTSDPSNFNYVGRVYP